MAMLVVSCCSELLTVALITPSVNIQDGEFEICKSRFVWWLGIVGDQRSINPLRINYPGRQAS